MRRLSLLLLLGCACGPSPEGAGLEAGLIIQGLSIDEIGYVQIAVLSGGSRFYCPDLVKSCLNQQVKTSDLVQLRGSDGQDHPALRFAADAGTLGSGQTLTVSMPPGTDYLVVAEILSKDGTLLKASGCEPLPQASAGKNQGLAIHAALVPSAVSCNPQIN